MIVEAGFAGRDLAEAAEALERHGPSLMVDIDFDQNFDYARQANRGAAPVSRARNVLALVDTGASISCIDEVLARELDLPVVDRKRLSGAGGAMEVDFYLAHIVVPGLDFTQWGRFAAVRLSAGAARHQALIGRNFLRQMLLIYDGPAGKVRIAR